MAHHHFAQLLYDLTVTYPLLMAPPPSLGLQLARTTACGPGDEGRLTASALGGRPGVLHMQAFALYCSTRQLSYITHSILHSFLSDPSLPLSNHSPRFDYKKVVAVHRSHGPPQLLPLASLPSLPRLSIVVMRASPPLAVASSRGVVHVQADSKVPC